MKNILPVLLLALIAFGCSQKTQPLVFDVAAVPVGNAKSTEAEKCEPVAGAADDKKIHETQVKPPRQIPEYVIKAELQKPGQAARVIAYAKKVHKPQNNNSGIAKASKPVLRAKVSATQYFFELLFAILAIAVGITAIIKLIKAYPIITISALAILLALPFVIWGFDLNMKNYFYYLLAIFAVLGMWLLVLGT